MMTPSRSLLFSTLIGAVASARSMTPMATLAAARLVGARTPGRLVLLGRPLMTLGALVMGVAELLGDKMKSAPDRTVPLGLVARVASAGIAGAALAPQGRERAGAVVAIPIPFIGPIIGALVGGGIGYLRTVTKKNGGALPPPGTKNS